MELFYTDTVIQDFFTLSNDEYRHCTKVLRKQKGDIINATNGKGSFLKGKIHEILKKELIVKITESNFYENNEKFNLAISPLKNAERIEWLVEKAVEIGINSISFINCQHTERDKINIERLRKIAVSAIKQSNKFWVPTINEPLSFEKFISQNKNGYIAHCYQTEKAFFNPKNINEECLILIGPEGDFSPDEVKAAINLGYKEVSLGSSRLRTETAGLFACNIFNFVYQIK